MRKVHYWGGLDAKNGDTIETLNHLIEKDREDNFQASREAL